MTNRLEQKDDLRNTEVMSIMPLDFGGSSLRMLMLDEEPWWVGLDATALLGIANGRQALRALEEYEKGGYTIATLGGSQEQTIINESGLYSLIFKSRRPEAKSFKKWLTTEVLPSIRQHGCYPPPPAIDPESIPSTQVGRFMIEVARFEARTGVSFLTASGIHRNRLYHIGLSGDGMVEHLNRNKLWLRVAGLGLDLHFILYGLQPAPPPFSGQRYIDRLN